MDELILEMDGVPVPLRPGTRISLEFASPAFDLEVVRGTRSMPFTIPRSAAADNLFAFQGNLQAAAPPRRSWPARLYAHGSLLLSGTFTLSKAAPRDYAGYLLAGTASIPAGLAATPLRSLALGGRDLPSASTASRMWFATVDASGMDSFRAGGLRPWAPGDGLRLLARRNGGLATYTVPHSGDTAGSLSDLAALFNADTAKPDTAHAQGTTLTIIERGGTYTSLSLLAGIEFDQILGDNTSYLFSVALQQHTHVAADTVAVFPEIENTAYWPGFGGIVNRTADPGSAADALLTAIWGAGPHHLQNTAAAPAAHAAQPCIRVRPLLQHIFRAAGLAASGPLLDDPAWESLILDASVPLAVQAQHIRRPPRGQTDPAPVYRPAPGLPFPMVPPRIDYAAHLPAWTVAEWLNALRIPFNLGWFFDLRARTVALLPLESVLAAPCTLDWTSRAVPAWSVTLADPAPWSLGPEPDPGEKIFKEDPLPFELRSLSQPPALEGASVPPLGADGIAGGRGGVRSRLYTLPPSAARPPLPVMPRSTRPAETGIFGGSPSAHAQARLLFYHGIVAGRPRASHLSADGALSLAWNGPQGLYESHWKNWAAFLDASRTVEIPLTPRPEDLASLDLSKKIHLRGNDYLIESLKVSLPLSAARPGTALLRRC